MQPSLGGLYEPAGIAGKRNLFALAWLHYDGFRGIGPTDFGKGRISYNESALVNLVEDDVGNRYIFTQSLYLDKSGADHLRADIWFSQSLG